MTTDNRRAMMIKVQIARKELCIDESTYRGMLDSLYGVASSTALSDGQLDDLLTHLQSRGWQPKPQRPSATAAKGKAPLMGKIEVMLKVARKPIAYGDGMARHMFGVEKMQWCDAPQLRKIVAALVYQQNRDEKRTTVP